MKRLCKGLTTLGAETVLCITSREGLATEFEAYTRVLLFSQRPRVGGVLLSDIEGCLRSLGAQCSGPTRGRRIGYVLEAFT